MIVEFIKYMIAAAEAKGEAWQVQHMTMILDEIGTQDNTAAETIVRWQAKYHRKHMAKLKGQDEHIAAFQTHRTKANNCEQIILAIEGKIAWQ